MNLDDLRQSLDEAAGPERTPTSADRSAVRRRARHGCTRRVAWVTALVVVLTAATTISVRALDSGSTPTVVRPGGLSATSWSAFCAQAARIQAAAEPGPAADPSLTTFRQRASAAAPASSRLSVAAHSCSTRRLYRVTP